MSSPHLNRRHFLAALAASVVAAGAALPIGFPKEVATVESSQRGFSGALKEMPWLFLYTGDVNWKVEARQAA